VASIFDGLGIVIRSQSQDHGWPKLHDLQWPFLLVFDHDSRGFHRNNATNGSKPNNYSNFFAWDPWAQN